MVFRETAIQGVFEIELERRGDERGFFARLYCKAEFAQAGLRNSLVQINNSLSREAGTLRGMHYQLPPRADERLVRCVKGAVHDVVLDIRPDSPTYLKSASAVLSAENRKMIFVPVGCAHGFLTLEPDTEIFYFVTDFYSPEHERGIRYNDPAVDIEWPMDPVVISEKDRNHPDFDPEIHLR